MTNYNRKWALTHIRKNWDTLVPTDDCPYCEGTGKADDYNDCGFCEAQDLDTETKK